MCGGLFLCLVFRILRQICVNGGKQRLCHIPDGFIFDLCAGCGAVAAAAQFFHHDLHIDVTDGAGGDVGVFAFRENDERGLDSGDIQTALGTMFSEKKLIWIGCILSAVSIIISLGFMIGTLVRLLGGAA